MRGSVEVRASPPAGAEGSRCWRIPVKRRHRTSLSTRTQWHVRTVHVTAVPCQVASRTGLRGGFQLDPQAKGIHPGIHRLNHCYHEVISGLKGGLRPGWLPKKSALSLAIFRAKPASIRLSPERNRKTTTWRSGLWLDPGSQPRCPPRDRRRLARAHDPEYIAIDSAREAIRLALRCLTRKCLVGHWRIDKPVNRRPRKPTSADRARAASGHPLHTWR